MTLTVWPNHVGVCNVELGQPPFILAEPTKHPDYRRGQIEWRYTGEPPDNKIVGRARIHCPAGDYTHFVYFNHPTDRLVVGLEKMAHPIHFELDNNIIDVDPIHNHDLELNNPAAPP
jgi:hypothetical protein